MLLKDLGLLLKVDGTIYSILVIAIVMVLMLLVLQEAEIHLDHMRKRVGQLELLIANGLDQDIAVL